MTPWVGIAALLLAVWATAAHRVTLAGTAVAATVDEDQNEEEPAAEDAPD